MIKLTKLMAIVITLVMIISFTACDSGAVSSDETNVDDSKSSGEANVDDSKSADTTEEEPETSEKIKIKFLSLSADENRNNIRENYIKVNVVEEMPNVEVEYDLGGGGQDYANKLKAYNASGDMPDVWFSEQNLSSIVVESGNALDLLPYVQESGFDQKFKMKDIVSPDKDGKLYCVQPGADQYFTPRLWYHKDIFDEHNIELPKTFDELISVCKALKDKGFVPMSIVGKDGWTPNLHMLQTMIMAEDPQVALDLVNNETDFSNPVIKRALGRIQKLVQVGAFAPGVTNIDYGPAIEMYTSGEAAMLAMFTWELGNLEEAAPDTDFIPWPSADEGVDPNGVIQYWGAPLSGYLVSANTENPEVAAEFAMFCATQDALYYNIEQKSPIMFDTGIEIEGMSELMQKNLDQFNGAQIKIPSIWTTTFNAKMSAEIATLNNMLLTGDYSPDDYIEAINPIWAENFD